MIFERTSIAGLLVVRTPPVADERGGFIKLFSAQALTAQGLPGGFVECSLSVTRSAGTVRGLHFQRAPHAETKLVCCIRGAIHDVVVDLRAGSPTLRQWQAFGLSDPAVALCVPPGCAHGFQALRDDSAVLYHMDTAYAPDHAGGVRFDDPSLGIPWPLPVGVVSDRDRAWPLL